MSDTFTWAFRFIHIFSGVVWVGGAILWSMIIAPNVLARGPPPIRRPFLEAVLAPFTRLMIIGGALTILSGFVVLGLLQGWGDIVAVLGGGGGMPRSYGLALGIGATAAIVMYLEGLFFIRPAADKLLKTLQALPPGAPPPPDKQAELAALGKKLGIAGATNMLLGTLAVGGMVWAVNVFR